MDVRFIDGGIVTAGHPKGGDMLQAAQDAFEAAGGFEADKRIANVLTGLGFKQTDWTKSCSEFSGGWQVTMRTALGFRVCHQLCC